MNTFFLTPDNYDLYNLELPIKTFIKGKKNIKTWIISNLERLHPRFLQQCDCDYKISFSKLKLVVQILVIDKLYLFSLKTQKTKRIGIKNKKKLYFFCKPKTPPLIAILFILFVFTSYFFIYQKNNPNINSIIKKTNNQDITLISNFDTTKQEISPTVTPLLSETLEQDNAFFELENSEYLKTITLLFDELLKKQIEVLNFNFKTENDFAKLNFIISNISPSEIIREFEENNFIRDFGHNSLSYQNSFNISEVSYINNVPQVLLDVFIPLYNPTEVEISNAKKTETNILKSNFSNNETISKLRSSVILNNGIIISEDVNNNTLQFSIKKNDLLGLIELNNFPQESLVTAFSINSLKNDLVFSVEFRDFGVPLKYLINTTIEKIFVKTKKNQNFPKISNTQKQAITSNSPINQPGTNKDIVLGKMTNENGITTLILKSSVTGKIYKEVQNENQM